MRRTVPTPSVSAAGAILLGSLSTIPTQIGSARVLNRGDPECPVGPRAMREFEPLTFGFEGASRRFVWF